MYTYGHPGKLCCLKPAIAQLGSWHETGDLFKLLNGGEFNKGLFAKLGEWSLKKVIMKHLGVSKHGSAVAISKFGRAGGAVVAGTWRG